MRAPQAGRADAAPSPFRRRHRLPHGGIPTWPLSRAAGLARALVQAAMFALLPIWAPCRVRGQERLRDLPGPVLFVANHVSHLDAPVLLGALPRRLRARVAVAAAKDYFFTGPLRAFAVGLAFNAFPVSRTASVRPPLAQFDFLTARGWSILLFPEGTRSISGQILPFKGGVAVLALELELPVVPIRTEGLHVVLPKGRAWPRRAPVEVRFGPPLRLPVGTTYAAATEAIEAALRQL